MLLKPDEQLTDGGDFAQLLGGVVDALVFEFKEL
ncbi:MAG: hypothetical protein ACI9VS_001352 [Candidatus Binatia bacterium]|jgi:hypothetical protein